MIHRRVFLQASAWSAAFGLLGKSAQADSAAAEAFILDLSNLAITELVTLTTNRERAVKLREILDAYFDMAKLAKHTLGLYWKRATPEEQTEYIEAFTAYMSHVYGKRFGEYSGQKLSIQRSRESGNTTTVYTIVDGAKGKPRVDWDVNGEGGKLKITDVRIEGLSLAETHRQEFASVISANGGKITALIAALKKKAASL
jgi:phospholipid transport system substrate-binding protein